MRLAQPEVIDSCAYWIGAHALAFLLLIFLAALGVIAALWHLFETRRLELWAHSDGWRRRVLERPFAQRLRQRYPRVWSFFGVRFASDSYLGLHLTIGLIVTLAAMVGFGALADAVADREELTEFDQQLAMSLHQNGTIDQVGIFEAITRFGDYRTLMCLGLEVSLALLISRRWLLLVGWVVALTGSGFLNAMLKALFHRVRPVFANPWLTEPGWSFPSGHAMGSLVAYGMLAYIIIVAWRVRFPRTIVAVSVALVLAIGFSRIFLGVHFFSDVAAGYAAAMMWLAICVSGCEVARRREQMRRFLSQLLTNERSKLAIEIALLSRRSFRNGGLGQARRGAYEKDPQLTPTSRLAGVELLAAPRTEIPRSASLIPRRDYFGRNHFILRTAEAGRQTDLKSLQTVLRGKGSGEQRREGRNRAVQAEKANCYDNALMDPSGPLSKPNIRPLRAQIRKAS